MSKIKKTKRSKVIKLFILLVILIIFLMLISISFVYARYTGYKIAKYNTKIAKPILELVNGENISINDNNKEGEYRFSIKNYNDKNEITDVKLGYTIEIIANEDKAIQYTLYKDDKQIPIVGNKSEEIEMNNNNKEEHFYKLKVKYDRTKNETSTDLIQDIQIKIHSEQERITV